MKKIEFKKGDSTVKSGISSKLKVAAMALGVLAVTSLGSCSEDDEESGCTDSDISTNADPVGDGDNC